MEIKFVTKLNHPDGPFMRDRIEPDEARVKYDKQVEGLIRRDRELDTEIRVYLQRSKPDTELVKCLKRQKLRLKDRIAFLNSHQLEHAPWS